MISDLTKQTSGEISLQELITNHINEFYSDSSVSVTHGTAEVTTENLVVQRLLDELENLNGSDVKEYSYDPQTGEFEYELWVTTTDSGASASG